MTDTSHVPRSIQNRLMRSLLLGFAVLGLIFGVAFHVYMQQLLTREFDEVLLDRARAITSTAELEADGKRYEFPNALQPEFESGPHAQYFHIRWVKDNTDFARSNSLPGNTTLAMPAALPVQQPVYYNLTLPDGRKGRAVSLWFNAMIEKESAGTVALMVDRSEPKMQLVLARDRKPLDHALAAVAVGSLTCAVLLGTATTWLLRRQLRQSLQPLNDVAKLASSVDATSLHQRFPVDEMPNELRPICQRLNDLLARIAKAVESQKRFNADAAHELRTPVSEVRALAEVALRWPEDADATRKAFQEIVAVTYHMERLSSVLLQLSRGDANGQVVTSAAEIHFAKTLQRAIDRRASDIAAKKLLVSINVPETLTIVSDATLLSAVVENLVDNAITYTPAGGRVECTSIGANSFEIANGPTNLTADDLAMMSDPFWRKDSSRSGQRMGLGLALTRAYLSTLRGTVSLSLDDVSRFTARVTLHTNK